VSGRRSRRVGCRGRRGGCRSVGGDAAVGWGAGVWDAALTGVRWTVGRVVIAVRDAPAVSNIRYNTSADFARPACAFDEREPPLPETGFDALSRWETDLVTALVLRWGGRTRYVTFLWFWRNHRHHESHKHHAQHRALRRTPHLHRSAQCLPCPRMLSFEMHVFQGKTEIQWPGLQPSKR